MVAWTLIFMQFLILLIEHFITVGFMEISHWSLLLAEFVFLALSYHAFDEQYKKMHLIVTEKLNTYISHCRVRLLQIDFICASYVLFPIEPLKLSHLCVHQT